MGRRPQTPRPRREVGMSKRERQRTYTKARLLALLAKCARSDDTESAHADADQGLIEFINDPDIAKAYGQIARWYA